MKSLTANELVSFCEWLKNQLVGAQLQDLWTDGEFVIFEFYRQKEIFVVLSLHPSHPVLWLQFHKPNVRKNPKPLTLFLNSHGRNKSLQEIFVLLDKGRSVLWVLEGRGERCEIEIDLIPKGPNFGARAGGKEIWWQKPKDLPPPVLPELVRVDNDWEKWSQEMSDAFFAKKASSQTSEKSGQSRAIEKKRKALEALEQQLQSDEADRYRELGEALKSSTEPPEDLRRLYDSKASVSENRERAFQKAKALERKKDGTRARKALIEKEIEKLLSAPPSEASAPKKASLANQAMQKADAQGRKLSLEGGFEAVIGKSAQDNLAILRKARAWDLWVHLKDEPGAHAILFRQRGQEVPQKLIQMVAEWVWNESRGKKQRMDGLKYSVIVVECRFVKPIRGDRLGRVTYTNPQTYTFASKTSS